MKALDLFVFGGEYFAGAEMVQVAVGGHPCHLFRRNRCKYAVAGQTVQNFLRRHGTIR